MHYYTKRDLYKAAGRIRAEHLSAPDPDRTLRLAEQFAASDRIDFVTLPFKTRGLRGMAVLAQEEGQRDVILLNSCLDEREQNFYCAHELCHLILHREAPKRQFNCFDKLRPHQDPRIEWQANEGAAEILIPYRSLLPRVRAAWPHLCTAEDIRRFRLALADTYLVSPTVIGIRLESLRYEIAQHLSGVPVDRVEVLSALQQKRRGMHVMSLGSLEAALPADLCPPSSAPLSRTQPPAYTRYAGTTIPPSRPAATPGTTTQPSRPTATPGTSTQPSRSTSTPDTTAQPSRPTAAPGATTPPSRSTAALDTPTQSSRPAATPGTSTPPSRPAATPGSPAGDRTVRPHPDDADDERAAQLRRLEERWLYDF